MEKSAKPILLALTNADAIELDAAKQRILATWIILKAMVAEFMSDDGVVTSQEQRDWIMVRREPPTSGWQIWIARLDNRPGLTGLFHIKARVSIGENSPTQPTAAPNTQSVTFICGRFLALAFSSRILPADNEFKGTRVRQIWPNKDKIIAWPPPARDLVSVRDAERLATVLTRIDGARYA